MQNLYTMYKTSISICKNMLELHESEPVVLNWAYFHAHQALNLLIRHELDLHFIKYPDEPTTKNLLGKLYQINSFKSITNLRPIADALDTWERESRYGCGVPDNVDLLKRVLKDIESLDKEINNYEKLNVPGYSDVYSEICSRLGVSMNDDELSSWIQKSGATTPIEFRSYLITKYFY